MLPQVDLTVADEESVTGWEGLEGCPGDLRNSQKPFFKLLRMLDD